jgi:hypothetical protein
MEILKILVPVRSRFGPGSLPVWSRFDPGSVPVRSRFGPEKKRSRRLIARSTVIQKNRVFECQTRFQTRKKSSFEWDFRVWTFDINRVSNGTFEFECGIRTRNSKMDFFRFPMYGCTRHFYFFYDYGHIYHHYLYEF